MKLQVLIVSTRPGRKGPAIAGWFNEFAQANSEFDVELVDLAYYNLPIYDEPNHPTQRQYVHEHTRKWSAKVAEADAFVFVLPEYDFGTPPSLTNALVYLYHEWSYKPVGFVSYGGVSGGIRAVQDTKLALTAFKAVPLYEGVPIPFFTQFIGDDNVFTPVEIHEKGAKVMLHELKRWADALKSLR